MDYDDHKGVGTQKVTISNNECPDDVYAQEVVVKGPTYQADTFVLNADAAGVFYSDDHGSR